MQKSSLVLLLGCGGSGLFTAPPKVPGHTGGPVADTDGDTDTDTDTDTDADADADTGTDPGTRSHTGATGPWSHPITVDGELAEWLPAETFPTSSGGTGYLSWDATNLYVAMSHPDVGTGGPSHWVTIYVGGGTGPATTAGVAHGTQAPTLPTAFTDLVRWKMDGSYDARLTWDGARWAETAGWASSAGLVAEQPSASTVEFALPRAAFGIGDQALVHVALVYEGAGFESSYAPIPAGSFPDGYDPDYGLYYAFDLAAAAAPTATPASP